MNSFDLRLGADALVEVGLSYVESISPNISTEDYDQLSAILTQFCNLEIQIDQASEQFKKILGRDDPVLRVKDVMETPDTPLPDVSPDEIDGPDSSHSRKKTRTWTTIEDQRLLAAIYHYGLDNWPAIAHYVGNGRTRAQCSQRWARGLNPRICKKHWSQEEEIQLQNLIRTYGEKSWTKISQIMGNRSDVQCRYHYRQLVKNEERPTQYIPLSRAPYTMSSGVLISPNPQIVMMNPKSGIQPLIAIQPDIVYQPQSLIPVNTIGNWNGAPLYSSAFSIHPQIQIVPDQRQIQIPQMNKIPTPAPLLPTQQPLVISQSQAMVAPCVAQPGPMPVQQPAMTIKPTPQIQQSSSDVPFPQTNQQNIVHSSKQIDSFLKRFA